MRLPRDYRGLTAMILALGVQANLMTLIVTESEGPNHIENTMMATIFGAALAAISVYIAGARPPRAEGQQPAAPGGVAAAPGPTPAPSSTAGSTHHSTTPRRIPTGETPAIQSPTKVQESTWPPSIREPWSWPGLPGPGGDPGDDDRRRPR